MSQSLRRAHPCVRSLRQEVRRGTRHLVQENNAFTWQRLTKKKVYVYFTTEDRAVDSNRLIINP